MAGPKRYVKTFFLPSTQKIYARRCISKSERFSFAGSGSSRQYGTFTDEAKSAKENPADLLVKVDDISDG
jgi:hypothetical protein